MTTTTLDRPAVTAASILTEAADLISDATKFTRDYSARGYNPSELRGDAPTYPPGSCLPTNVEAQTWNALGAIWRRALTHEADVKEAHGFFVKAIGADVSVNRWCSAHEQADQIAALRAAAQLAEAAQ